MGETIEIPLKQGGFSGDVDEIVGKIEKLFWKHPETFCHLCNKQDDVNFKMPEGHRDILISGGFIHSDGNLCLGVNEALYKARYGTDPYWV